MHKIDTLFYRITYDPFCFIKIKIVRQIRFNVCIKMRRCKRRVCKRKILFGQPNNYFNAFNYILKNINLHKNPQFRDEALLIG